MRRHYLDNIRWLTVILVIIYHVFYMFNACGVIGGVGGFSDVQYQDIFPCAVYPWFMVLLFTIAGISARYALENKTVKEFIGARTVKLLIPSTLGLFVLGWIGGYLNVFIGGGLDYLPKMPVIRYLIFSISGNGPVWFIQMLWLFSLLAALIYKLDKRDKLYSACGKIAPYSIAFLWLVLWGGAQIGNVPVISVYRFGIYSAAFLSGFLILSHDNVQQLLKKLWLPLLILALIFGVFYTIRFFGTDYSSSECLKSFLTNDYAAFMTLAIIGCGKAWWDRTDKFCTYMKNTGFGMYILHYPMVVGICYLLKTQTTLPAALIYIIAIAVSLGGTYILYQIIKRIPFIRFAVLGMRKK